MKSTNRPGYITPAAEVIGIQMESVLCQSEYGVQLENMSESEYTITF